MKRSHVSWVAFSPRIARHGSPGIMRARAKVTIRMPKSTGMADSVRRVRNFVMSCDYSAFTAVSVPPARDRRVSSYHDHKRLNTGARSLWAVPLCVTQTDGEVFRTIPGRSSVPTGTRSTRTLRCCRRGSGWLHPVPPATTPPRPLRRSPTRRGTSRPRAACTSTPSDPRSAHIPSPAQAAPPSRRSRRRTATPSPAHTPAATRRRSRRRSTG